MPRPQLYSFTALQTQNELSVKANVNFVETGLARLEVGSASETSEFSAPLESIGLIRSRECRIKIVGSNGKQIVLEKEYDSDSFGSFDLKIPLRQKIDHLLIYETSSRGGIELILGSYLPLTLSENKKLLISDFDKTLVDTKFSTLKEMLYSLRHPVSSFPNVDKSIELFKNYADEGFTPFILSASPHFYEKSIRDWIYQNKLYAAHLFLKDYRNIFSLTQGILTPKDLKKQGFYKLSQLVDLLLMTGIPDEIVLMGDAFESDTFIYLTLLSVIAERYDPWKLWGKIKKERPFLLTSKQDSQFLTKFYQLSEMARLKPLKNFRVLIRYNEQKKIRREDFSFPISLMEKLFEKVEFYLA